MTKRKADVAAEKGQRNARQLSEDIRRTFNQKSTNVLPRLIYCLDVDLDFISKTFPYKVTFSNGIVMCLDFKRNTSIADPPDREQVSELLTMNFR